MPKSKRARVVSLTKTQSQGRAGKAANIERIQGLCDEFSTIFLYSCANMRTNLLKRLRNEMKDNSQFYMGKNTLARLAFGKTKETAYLPDLEKLSRNIRGDVGILFTNKPADEVEKYFSEYSELDFARAGNVAAETITRNKGPCSQFPSSMYEPLRKLQLPVVLKKGIIEFEEDYAICVKGDVLSPEQAQALKIFEHKIATFKVKLLFRYREGRLTRLVSEKTLEELNATEQMQTEDDEESKSE